MDAAADPAEFVPSRVRLLRRADGVRASTSGFRRIRHGVFVEERDVPRTEHEAMHFLRMQAAAERMSQPPVFSHVSAAVAWGLPLLGRLPTDVHAAAWTRVGFRTSRGIVWHNDALPDADVAEVDGVLVTNLARTLVDLARTLPFPDAVAALDYGVRPRITTPFGTEVDGVPRSLLMGRVNTMRGQRGIVSARRAVAFCDAASGSPGESISRAHMHTLGFPPPRLQVPFARADGRGEDVVDFDWPELGRFGEFDGRGKYLREEFTGGLSIQEVLWREKLREDRIRRHRPVAVRWDWAIALRPKRLAARLIEFGIHPRPLGRRAMTKWVE